MGVNCEFFPVTEDSAIDSRYHKLISCYDASLAAINNSCAVEGGIGVTVSYDHDGMERYPGELGNSGDIHRLQFLQSNFTDSFVGIVTFRSRQGNKFPYLHKEGHFCAMVTVSKEGMVIMEIDIVESVGHDFGGLEQHLRR